MKILVRHGIVIDYCNYDNDYICTGSTVVCTSKNKTFEDCSIVSVNSVPSDIDDYEYYYELGEFHRGRDYDNKSDIISTTLLAANWSGNAAPYTYTLSVQGITTESNQEILLATGATQAQIEAAQKANMLDGGQSSNSILINAWGDKPTIDIPIRVIIRKD